MLAEVAQDGLGLGIVLALAGLVVAVSLVERQPAIALAGAVVAAGSFATNGHTRAGSSVALATISDVTHLLAAAAWGGGLVLLALCLRARRRAEVPTTDTVTLVGRYSTLATITIVLVGLSGAALAWFEVGSLGAFTSTGYGRLLLVKIAVVAVIAALGAYNHFRLVPALARGKAKASLAQLRTTLTIEILALAVVVALTSVLVVVTPARAESEGGVVEEIVTLGDAGSVQLTIAARRGGLQPDPPLHLRSRGPARRHRRDRHPRAHPPRRPARPPHPRGDAGRSRPLPAQRHRPRRRRHLDHRGASPPRPLHRGDRLGRGAHCWLSPSNAAADAA